MEVGEKWFAVEKKPVQCITPSMERADREQKIDPIY